MWVKCDKALRELGLSQRTPEEALERAVHWYWQNSYAPLPKGRAVPPTLVVLPSRTKTTPAPAVRDQAGTLN
jgi:hypothetical protein